MKKSAFIRFDSYVLHSARQPSEMYAQSGWTKLLEDAKSATGDNPAVLINVSPKAEGSSFFAVAMIVAGHKLHLIGECLLFFQDPVHLDQSILNDTTHYYTWRNFTARFGTPTTIFPSRSSYTEIIRLLGPTDALHTLQEIGDISAARALPVTGGKFSSQMRHPELIRLLSVDTEAFLAYTSLGRQLQQSREIWAPPPEILNVEIELGGRNQAIELEFKNHERKGRQPINAVIGPNGTGKTRLLAALARQLSSSHAQWPQLVLVYAQDRTSMRELGVRRSNRVKIIRMREEWANATRKLDDVSARCLEGVTTPEVVSRLINGVIDVDRLFVPVNPDTILLADTSAIYHFNAAYLPFGYFTELLTSGRRLLLDHGRCPLISDANRRLHRPSSGEATIILLLLSIFIEAVGGALILIDEPETNLHPRFISLLMKSISDILLATNSLAVLATHSPFVIRELDRSSVTILRGSGDDTEVFFPTLQTHGSNVSEITSYVFDDDESSKGYEEVVEAISSRFMLSEKDTTLMATELFGSDAVSFSLIRRR